MTETNKTDESNTYIGHSAGKEDASKLTAKEAEIIFNQFSSLQIQTSADDFLEAATVIDSIKRKMKMQIEKGEGVKV